MKTIDFDWKVKKWQEIKPVQINSDTPKGQGLNLDYMRSLFSKIMQLPSGFSLNP